MGEGGDSYWLLGRVGDRQERLIPRERAGSAAGLLQQYPKGAVIPVLINPNESDDFFIQGEILRVREYTPDFWDREAKLRHRLALYVLAPVPLTAIVYILVRYANRRRQRQVEQATRG